VTCRQFAAFIADFLDGSLPDAERQEFDRHVSRCANCARYLEGYRQTVAVGKRAFDDIDSQLPRDVPDELVCAILQARRNRS
jgi:anti-sigma factor RsiW